MNNIDAKLTIGLESPKGNIHLRCDLIIESGNDWKIKLSGPLGVDLALIEIHGERYTMKNLQLGETTEGYTDEVLFIPNFDVQLPPLKILASMIIPYPNIIYPQDWVITGSNLMANGDLKLSRSSQTGIDVRVLHLDYNPLRVHDEVITLKEATTLSRSFKYADSKSFLPNFVESKFGELVLKITYNALTITKSTKSSFQLIPL